MFGSQIFTRGCLHPGPQAMLRDGRNISFFEQRGFDVLLFAFFVQTHCPPQEQALVKGENSAEGNLVGT